MDSENEAKPFCQQQTGSEGRQFVHRLLLVRWRSKERRSGNGLGSESSPVFCRGGRQVLGLGLLVCVTALFSRFAVRP